MDNGTMVEAFKYFKYCQLAKNSLVSKRFRNLIQTHRHKLALLYVDDIRMDFFPIVSADIKVFGRKLCSEAYNDWLIRKNYSKQIPIDSQVASDESTQSITNSYYLAAYACYKDLNNRRWKHTMTVFYANAELNHENWPLFQHFVCLATDPFIYINRAHLTYKNDVLNSLAGAMNSDHDRLQCKDLAFNTKGDIQKSITWIKNHVRCNNLYINDVVELNQLEAFLDFFVTGAHCTSSIGISNCDFSKVVTDFVQKFTDLKNSGEVQLVETIEGKIRVLAIESFKRDYAEFIVKDEGNEDGWRTEQVYEFVNNDIGKKLQLTAKTNKYLMPDFLIKIISL